MTVGTGHDGASDIAALVRAIDRLKQKKGGGHGGEGNNLSSFVRGRKSTRKAWGKKKRKRKKKNL